MLVLQQANDPKNLFDQYLQKMQQLDNKLKQSEEDKAKSIQTYQKQIQILQAQIDEYQKNQNLSADEQTKKQLKHMEAMLQSLQEENAYLKKEGERQQQLSQVQQKLKGKGGDSAPPKKQHYEQGKDKPAQGQQADTQSVVSYKAAENIIDDKDRTDQGCQPCTIF